MALVGQSDALVTKKVICLFELRSEITEARDDFYYLLAHKQIKYAEKLTRLSVVTVDDKILDIFAKYIQDRESRETLKLLLNILSNVTGNFDRTLLVVNLSRSLNPIIKKLALELPDLIQIDRKLALQLCFENLKIGNKSSVEFAIELIKKFNLEDTVSKEDVIASLLREPKFQRIELAYKLVRKHGLPTEYLYKYLLKFLIGYYVYENLALARQIILNESPLLEQQQALHHLCSLALRDAKFHKLAKQILFEDLQNYEGVYKVNNNYTGFVSGVYNGKYQIHFSTNHGSIDISRGKLKLKINSIVTFRFNQIGEKIEASDITIVASAPISSYVQKYWYQDYYVGQIINFHPTLIRPKSALMTIHNKKISFILSIGEIAPMFISDINDFVSLKSAFEVQILSFDPTKRLVYCSKKALMKPNKYIENDSFEDKISLLVKKYSR